MPTAFRLHPVSLRAFEGVLWVLNCVWLCVVVVTGAGGAHHPYSSRTIRTIRAPDAVHLVRCSVWRLHLLVRRTVGQL